MAEGRNANFGQGAGKPVRSTDVGMETSEEQGSNPPAPLTDEQRTHALAVGRARAQQPNSTGARSSGSASPVVYTSREEKTLADTHARAQSSAAQTRAATAARKRAQLGDSAIQEVDSLAPLTSEDLAAKTAHMVGQIQLMAKRHGKGQKTASPRTGKVKEGSNSRPTGNINVPQEGRTLPGIRPEHAQLIRAAAHPDVVHRVAEHIVRNTSPATLGEWKALPEAERHGNVPPQIMSAMKQGLNMARKHLDDQAAARTAKANANVADPNNLRVAQEKEQHRRGWIQGAARALTGAGISEPHAGLTAAGFDPQDPAHHQEVSKILDRSVPKGTEYNRRVMQDMQAKGTTDDLFRRFVSPHLSPDTFVAASSRDMGRSDSLPTGGNNAGSATAAQRRRDELDEEKINAGEKPDQTRGSSIVTSDVPYLGTSGDVEHDVDLSSFGGELPRTPTGQSKTRVDLPASDPQSAARQFIQVENLTNTTPSFFRDGTKSSADWVDTTPAIERREHPSESDVPASDTAADPAARPAERPATTPKKKRRRNRGGKNRGK